MAAGYGGCKYHRGAAAGVVPPECPAWDGSSGSPVQAGAVVPELIKDGEGAENGCGGPVAAACGICCSGQGPEDGVGAKGQRGAPYEETPWGGHGVWP